MERERHDARAEQDQQLVDACVYEREADDADDREQLRLDGASPEAPGSSGGRLALAMPLRI